MNKLAAENFHKLSNELFSISIPNLRTLESVVDIIFDKATLEPTFCSLYSQLCYDWCKKPFGPSFKDPNTEKEMVPTFRFWLNNS